MTKAVRLQLSRRKGFNLQSLSIATNALPAVNVARPSKWGNPLHVGMWRGYNAAAAVADFHRWIKRDVSVRSYDNTFGKPPSFDEIRRELRGKNLACWCPPGVPCHADVLLEIANAQEIPA